MPKLVVKKQGAVIKKLSVPETVDAFTVGCEHGNDIVIKDDLISFFHLQIEKRNDDYFVRDLQSQWGTLINGHKISGKTRVFDKDTIALGKHEIVFLTNSEQPAMTSSPADLLQTSFAREQSPDIEEQIAGIPVLGQLNSWLHNNDNENGKQSESFVHEEIQVKPVAPEPLIRRDPMVAAQTLQRDDTLTANGLSLNGAEIETPNIKNGAVEVEESKPADFIVDTVDTNDVPRTETQRTASMDFYTESQPQVSQPVSGITKYYLLGIYGYYLGRKFKIKQPQTRIGRDGKLNDITIRKNSKGKFDQSISRRHATIKLVDDRWYLSDKRSKSRTWLNQKELKPEDQEEIRPGDEIEIVSDKKSHIFRMVEDGQWDFGFPRKSGAWHVRHRIKIFNICSLVMLAILGFFLIDSFLMARHISKAPAPFSISENIWGASDIDSKFDNQEQNIEIFPGLSDFNQDGFLDLVYVNNRGFLNCINGNSKTPLWTNNEFQAIYSIPVTIEDMLGKGTPDIIVASSDSRLRAIDGKWGIEIWRSPILSSPLTTPPAVHDFNGDGLKDIAVLAGGNSVYIGYATLQNYRWTKLELDAPLQSVVSSHILGNSGYANILIGTETGKVIIIDGSTQSVLGEININEEISKANGLPSEINQIRFPVAFGDVNGDAIEDIIIVTEQGNLITLDGSTFERLWYDDIADSQPEESGGISLALGDMDGDGLTDMVVQSASGKIRALKGLGQGKDRKMILWEHRLESGDHFVANPVLCDFNKNGTEDVLTTSSKGMLTILEGATGKSLARQASSGATVRSQPLIGDLDNDNYLDIIALKSDGRFYKIASNSLTPSGALVWGQTFGSSRHASTASFKKQKTSIYYLYIGLSFLSILLLAGLHAVIKIKRKRLSFY